MFTGLWRLKIYAIIRVMTSNLTLSFLIPAYNDEATIEAQVREAIAVGKRVAKQFEVRVIDDRSRDNTWKILQKLDTKHKEVHVSRHGVNKGYGGTIKELYYLGKYDWLYSIPGDYQIGAREVEKLLPHRGGADMILGWRDNRVDPEERLRQSRIYNTLLRTFYGVRVHDVNSVRLMRRSMLKQLQLVSDSAFVDAELVIRARKQGFTVTEIPIDHRGRAEDAKQGGGGNVGTIIPTIVDMVRYRLGML